MRSGISARHGGHHVAQKLTRTTLPLRSLELIVLPLKSVTEKSATGAGLRRSWTTGGPPDSSTAPDPAGSAPLEQEPAESAAASATAPRGSRATACRPADGAERRRNITPS